MEKAENMTPIVCVNSLWWAKGIHPVAGLLQPDPMGHPGELPELKTAPLPTSHHLQGENRDERRHSET